MPRNLIHADAIVDYRGVIASPGAILVEGNQIIEAGTPQEIGLPENASLTQIDSVVTPSFVNTHTHLDLSGVGITPAKESYTSWVEEVVFPIRSDTSSIGDSVLRGIELVHSGGSSIIGDISGSEEAAQLVYESHLRATPFVELLGTGTRQQSVIEFMNQLPSDFGVEPHAPYSCGLDVYREAFASGRPVATHLAETLEELEYAQHRTGPIAKFVQRIGAWEKEDIPWSSHPIDIVLQLAGDTPCIVAHLNYIDDCHLQRLADSNMTVAYCPRASAYFGHTNHRWQEMIDAGVNVSIGTDSLLCLDTPNRISVIDEMRFLYHKDKPDPVQLIAMGTIHGASGLGLDPNLVTLHRGETAGLLAFMSQGGDPLLEIMNSTTMPIWLSGEIELKKGQ